MAVDMSIEDAHIGLQRNRWPHMQDHRLYPSGDTMEINLDAVGKVYELPPFTYDWKACATYALGIGAGREQLSYTWEGSDGFKVYPSFAVVPVQPIVFMALKDANADFRKLVHGEQTIRMHGAIPSKGSLHSRGRITEIHDKIKGAVVFIETETSDADGRLLFETAWSIFCRGQGSFGGDRGSKKSIPDPIEGAEAALDVTLETVESQALLYRLSGDFNPLHVDPVLAGKVGFPAPILHGLCSYGFAVRAVVEHLCGDDPSKLKRFSARFSREVYPGDSLNVQAIPAEGDGGVYRLQVDVGDRTVLSHGVVEIC
jgi:acyl dehydratase